jgi:hypothetical protein
MWETLLDAMERRYRRREGVSDEDLAAVRKILAGIGPADEDGERNADDAGSKPADGRG